jgi:L-iditol 2-dehydrogenase
MPETSCFPISDEMSYDEAAMSEPLAIGTYAVNESIPMKNATVGILGFGPIGMSVMLAARSKGAENIYVTDKINERLKIAIKNGASFAENADEPELLDKILQHEPNMLDVVFECCGKQEAINQAVDLLKPGGKLMVIGIPEFSHWTLPVDKTRHKEITIRNVRRQNDTLDETLQLIAQHKVDVAPMVTHRFPFSKTKEAFDLVMSYGDGVMKAMIDF